MTPTTVANINNGEPYDVYIGRAGHGHDGIFGNPFPLVKDNKRTREKCINQYREYFYQRLETDVEFKQRVLELKGKVLGCFCLPQKLCHGTVIAEYLNNLGEKQ